MDNICIIKKKVVPLHSLNKKHRGVEQLVARQAHNLEVACSSPASATQSSRNKLESQQVAAFFIGRNNMVVGQTSNNLDTISRKEKTILLVPKTANDSLISHK